jgi:putative ABC transport system permease protein
VHIRSIVRRLRRAPAFTAVALLTLALGIGANTTIFSVIEGVLLKPLPYPQHERLVALWYKAPGVKVDKLNVSAAMYFTYREEGRVFEDVGVWNGGSFTITGTGEPERLPGIWTTHEVLGLLGARPTAGRLFAASDDWPGSASTVVLSHGYWQRRFGGDASAVGRQILLNGESYRVIGVLSREFRFMDQDADFFCPKRLDRSKIRVDNFNLQGVARLKPGVTLNQANAEAARMLTLAFDHFPTPTGFTRQMFEDAHISPALVTLKDDVVGDIGKALWLIMGTAGIVLLIACANVANLFLVRAEGRQQEFAIRTALGAGRWRMARDLLGESIGMALFGGALGVGFAYAGIRLLRYLEPSNFPRLSEIRIDAPALLFTLGISILSGALFGLIPVFRFTARGPAGALKEGGRGLSEGRQRHRARNALVVAQVALALVLLVSAGLMIRTFQALRNVNPGFVRPAEVLTLRIFIPRALANEQGQSTRMHEQIAARIRELPGVASVSLSNSLPMDGNNGNDPIFVEQFPTPEGQIPSIRRYKYVSPAYFETLGNPILAGRAYTWDDVYGSANPILVSWSLAHRFWKTPAEAVGKRIRETPRAPWRTIIGVAGDERDDGAHRPAPEIAYWPLMVNNHWGEYKHAEQSAVSYAIRSARAGTPDLLNDVRRAVMSVNPSLPVSNVGTLERTYKRSMARTSFTLVMLGIAGGLALLLGLVGIYGVIAYSVTQRTREIGIRIALGAEAREVRALFVRHALTLAAIGVLIGAGAALTFTRAMSTLLYGVAAMDPLTYALVAAILAAAALLASYIPARRATLVDPASALRAE